MKRIFRLVACAACGSMFLFVLPALAQAQTVSTAGATNVTSTSATLVGYLNPPQIFYAYSFQYGTSMNYDHGTPAQTAPAGNGLTEVTAQVTGLSPGTTYHVQLAAAIQTSTTNTLEYGGDKTFTTKTTGSGSGSGSSASGSLRLVGRTLGVKGGKASVSLWCLGSHSCGGALSVSASGKRCVSGKAFSLGAGNAMTIKAKVSRACRTLLRNASRHKVGGKLTATLSTGQASLSSKVTLARM